MRTLWLIPAAALLAWCLYVWGSGVVLLAQRTGRPTFVGLLIATVGGIGGMACLLQGVS